MTDLDNVASTARMAAYSTTLQTYLFDPSPVTRMSVMSSSTDLMQNMIDAMPLVVDIFFYSKADRLLFARGVSRLTALTMLADYNLVKIPELSKPFYSKIYYDDDNVRAPYCFFVMPVFNSLPGQFTSTNAGICVVQFNANVFQNDDINHEKLNSSITAVVSDNQIISSNTSDPSFNLDWVSQLSDEPVKRTVANTTFLVRGFQEERTGWLIATSVPMASLDRDSHQ